MICEFCECAFSAPILKYEKLDEDPKTHPKTFQSLKSSANEGCPVCLLLWKHLVTQLPTMDQGLQKPMDSTALPEPTSLSSRLEVSHEFHHSYSDKEPSVMEYSFIVDGIRMYKWNFKLLVMETGGMLLFRSHRSLI